MEFEWRVSPVDPPADGRAPTGEFWTPVRLPGSPVSFAGADHLAYRTIFDDPRDEPTDTVYLRVYGCPGPFALWVNGELHERVQFPVRPRQIELNVTEGTNEVVLLCGRPQHRFAGIYDADELPHELTVPAPRWELSLDVIEQVTPLDLAVRPRLKGEVGVLKTTTSVIAPEGFEGDLTVSVRPEGVNTPGARERRTLSLEPGETQEVETVVTVPAVERWHPRPDLHRGLYRVTVDVAEEELSTIVGFRSLSMNEDTLLVNSRRVPLRGFTVRPGVDPSRAVERVIEANANAIRPLGHVPHEALYDACLSAGVLVWQDMPLRGPGEIPREEGCALATELAGFLAGKASLGMIAMHDDPFDTATTSVGSGYLGNLKLRWRTYRESHDKVTIDAIADILNDVAPTIPAIGGPGVDALAGSLYPGVYHGPIEEVGELFDRHAASFIAATGSPGATVPRGRVPDQWRSILAPHGIESAHSSRTHQRDVCKRVIETARLEGYAGTVVHTLFDIDRDGGFGVLTSQDERKPAFKAVAQSFEPVQSMLDPPFDADRPMVVLVNDTGGRIAATVTVEAGPDRYEFNASAPAYSVRELDRIQLPRDITSVQLVTDYENRRISNHYDLETDR